MEEILLGYLKSDASVSAAGGGRVSWTWRQQGTALPALTLTRIGGMRDRALDGASGLVESHVQADCWGAYQLDAKVLARAVVVAVQAITAENTSQVIQGAFVDAEHDSFEGEQPDRIFRTMLTLKLWHSEV